MGLDIEPSVPERAEVRSSGRPIFDDVAESGCGVGAKLRWGMA